MRLLTDLCSTDGERRSRPFNNGCHDNGLGGRGLNGSHGDCCELNGSATDMSADSGVACDLDPSHPDFRIDTGTLLSMSW